ncbi:MAG: tryptophan synthase subunit alpha [Nitrososphaeraceae archaeon]|nr:tryptophan synthase subunit alpha [Nitrososphaeraceae archaeon]
MKPNNLNRIDKKFRELKNKREKALICYVVAGYPDIKTSEKIIDTLIESGADMIEIGIPFSDPIADGKTIQEALHSSLTLGITPQQCLELSERIRVKHPEIPLLIMTYSNILFRRGYDNFSRDAKKKGIDGFILPDVSIEESLEYVNAAKKNEMSTIFLVSPNTSELRLKMIIEHCSGFLYAVSVFGITGERQKFHKYTFAFIRKVRKLTKGKIPIAAGFGISQPEHVKNMIDAGADAVIVGSAIIRKIQETKTKKTSLALLSNYILDLKLACRENKKRS